MFIFSKSMAQKLLLLRSGSDGALLQVYEEDTRYLQFQPCHGRLLPGSEFVEQFSRPLLNSHDQEMLIYNIIFVWMNLKPLPNHIIRS